MVIFALFLSIVVYEGRINFFNIVPIPLLAISTAATMFSAFANLRQASIEQYLKNPSSRDNFQKIRGQVLNTRELDQASHMISRCDKNSSELDIGKDFGWMIVDLYTIETNTELSKEIGCHDEEYILDEHFYTWCLSLAYENKEKRNLLETKSFELINKDLPKSVLEEKSLPVRLIRNTKPISLELCSFI